jgi:hypothetical protein
MDIASFQIELEKFKKLPRTHANFFNWHDKEIKEIGIGQDFFQKLEELTGEYLVGIKNAEDPPDVIIKTNSGRCIGVEITELVDRKAIEYQIKNDQRYAERIVHWSRENTIQKITEIIENKDKLCRSIPLHYDLLVLLIFTDEPRLTSDALNQYVEGHHWVETENIEEIYILTGYEAKYNTKKLIKLK